MIVLVSCGARKHDRPIQAGLMYTGPYATSALRWARSVVPEDRIFILSAKYGLVPYHHVIDPYEMRLSDPAAVGPARIHAQASAYGLMDEHEVLVAGGRPYVALARSVWPHAVAPFADAGGMGYQMRAMKQAFLGVA